MTEQIGSIVQFFHTGVVYPGMLKKLTGINGQGQPTWNLIYFTSNAVVQVANVIEDSTQTINNTFKVISAF